MDTRRKERRADKRRRRALNRILPLVRTVGADLATDALHMLAAGTTAEEVARVLACRVSRARPQE